MNLTPTTLRPGSNASARRQWPRVGEAARRTSSADQSSLAHVQPQFAAFAGHARLHGEPDYPARNHRRKRCHSDRRWTWGGSQAVTRYRNKVVER
jgi:hypothetical protein